MIKNERTIDPHDMIVKILKTKGYTFDEITSIFKIMDRAPNIFTKYLEDRIKLKKNFGWLEIKKYPVSGNKFERIVLYTPNTIKRQLDVKYRIVDVDSAHLMKDATHWAKLKEPK
jgi:hypothetical protein